MTGIIVILLTLALIGFVLWAIITYIPMPPIFKNIFIVIAAILILLWLIQRLGGLPA